MSDPLVAEFIDRCSKILMTDGWLKRISGFLVLKINMGRLTRFVSSKILMTDGWSPDGGGDMLIASTDRITIELGYSKQGREFFDVLTYWPGEGTRRILRRTDGETSLARVEEIKEELEHLRRLQVLDDLANA